jgi:serine/threonine-protein kinase
MVMEYVEGASLSALLRRVPRGTIEFACVARVCVDALRGLHAAHELRDREGRPANVIHRDVTPQNLLVGLDGMTRLTDFGVAKAEARATVTKEGAVKGKLGYLAPEQLKGRAVDRRVDLFAAGVVLWEALVGERLFRGTTDADTVGQVLTAPIHPPSTLRAAVPPALDAVVMKALEREPDHRYATAEALAEALELAVAPASHAEVGKWVRAWMGDELDVRHDRLAGLTTQVDAVEEMGVEEEEPPPPGPAAEPAVVSSVYAIPRPTNGGWKVAAAIIGVVGLLGGLGAYLLLPPPETGASTVSDDAGRGEAAGPPRVAAPRVAVPRVAAPRVAAPWAPAQSSDEPLAPSSVDLAPAPQPVPAQATPVASAPSEPEAPAATASPAARRRAAKVEPRRRERSGAGQPARFEPLAP